MAKKAKAHAEPKKRKSATPAPKAEEGKVLGTVSIPVQTSVIVTDVASFNELVIEWGCLGLSEEPDAISETSGNSRLLDPKRSPRTDEEGLHVFFSPSLPAGSYGFQFVFHYNEAVEPRSSVTPTDEEREKEEKEHSAEAA